MTLTADRLVIRADADSHMGTGHVMRCLALAQAWQDLGGEVTILTANGSQAMLDRLKSERVEVVELSVSPGSASDAKETTGLAMALGASWLVVDGYHFSGDYQMRLKEAGLRLLSVDDYGHADRYASDLVLNQNLYARESLYGSREPYCQLLLGTRFVLLRREFARWSGWKRQVPEVARKVLVTLGGGDSGNVTLKVVEALRKIVLDGLEAVVVAGASNPHHQELQSATQGSPHNMRLESNVKEMPELMAWADVAVSAGGTTSWELAFMGLPALTLVLAKNQERSTKELVKRGVLVSLGNGRSAGVGEIGRGLERLLASSGMRRDLSQNGPLLVDGLGARRAVEAMLKLERDSR